MRILPITTNQQNTSNTKNPNFGAFRADTPEILKGVRELLQEEVFLLAEVLRKGENVVENEIPTIGQYLSPRQITYYLKQNPNTYLVKKDMLRLIPSISNVTTAIERRLNEVLSKAPRITLNEINEALPYVRKARANAIGAETRAKTKLGIGL